MPKLRAAIITDIHHGPDSGAKLGTKALKLLDHFAKAANKYKPDFVVDMGDRISSRAEHNDSARMQEVRDRFNKLAAPLHCILGNHDVKRLSRKENERITGSPSASWSMDQGGYHFVFWNPGGHDGSEMLKVDGEDLDWLRDDLARTGKPSVVFSHVPLDDDSETRNAPFGSEPGIIGRFGYLDQGSKIRDILEKSGRVILCMSGHIHANRYREINGIHYFVQQSLVHTWQEKYRVPIRAHSWLELDDDKIKIRLRGKVKKTWNLDARPEAFT